EGGEGGAGVQKEERELPSQLDTPFLFSEQKYLPFQQRRAKQSWRRLKQQSFRQPTEEVDVRGTVRALARNGFFFELVFETRKVSRQHFVVLLDHGGSMTPHHHLFDFFIQGLRESTHYTEIETYFFTNYPPYKVGASGLPEYRFFTNMEHTASVTLSSLLAGWEKNTVVLFLSDAGAAHDGMNPARVQVTMELLNRLESKVEHVLWFNPLPGHLWKGSAGAFFGGVVPMLECTEAGIQQAVGRIR
ncbi:MAG: VWA domain-containing protein, partial [Phaeodactylibacter sp.]|nr:VWA domain-containing protein [Phaeodactylibacter sp.]